MKIYGKIRLVFSSFNSKFLPSTQITDQTIRVKALQDKVVPQKIVVKPRDSFFIEQETLFLIMQLRISLSD